MSFSHSDPVRSGAIFRISNPDLLRSPLPVHALKRKSETFPRASPFSQASQGSPWGRAPTSVSTSSSNSPRWGDANSASVSSTPSNRSKKSPIRVTPRIASTQYRPSENGSLWAAGLTPSVEHSATPVIRPKSVADIAKSSHRRQYLYETNSKFDELVRASPIPQIVKSMSNFGGCTSSTDRSPAPPQTPANDTKIHGPRDQTAPESEDVHNSTSQRRHSTPGNALHHTTHGRNTKHASASPADNTNGVFKKPQVTPAGSRRRHQAHTDDGGSPDLLHPSLEAHPHAASTQLTRTADTIERQHRRSGGGSSRNDSRSANGNGSTTVPSPGRASKMVPRDVSRKQNGAAHDNHGAAGGTNYDALGTLLSMVQGDVGGAADEHAPSPPAGDEDTDTGAPLEDEHGPPASDDVVPMTSDDDIGDCANAVNADHDHAAAFAATVATTGAPVAGHPRPRTALANTPAGSRQLTDWWIKTSSNGVQVEGFLPKHDDSDSASDDEETLWHSSAIVKRVSFTKVMTKSGALYELLGTFLPEECDGVPVPVLDAFAACNQGRGGFPLHWKRLVHLVPGPTRASASVDRSTTTAAAATKRTMESPARAKKAKASGKGLAVGGAKGARRRAHPMQGARAGTTKPTAKSATRAGADGSQRGKRRAHEPAPRDRDHKRAKRSDKPARVQGSDGQHRRTAAAPASTAAQQQQRRQESAVPAPSPIALDDVQGLHKTRRSGRTVVPPLAFWKGQRLVEDRGASQMRLVPGSSDRTALSVERYAIHRTDEEDFLLQSPTVFASDYSRRRIRPAAAAPIADDDAGGMDDADTDDAKDDVIDDMLNDAAQAAADGSPASDTTSEATQSDTSDDGDTVVLTPRRSGVLNNATLFSSPSSSESSKDADETAPEEEEPKRHSPLSAYEAQRALNIARNTQVLEQLGLSGATTTNPTAMPPSQGAGETPAGGSVASPGADAASLATGGTTAGSTAASAAPATAEEGAVATARVLPRRTTRASARHIPSDVAVTASDVSTRDRVAPTRAPSLNTTPPQSAPSTPTVGTHPGTTNDVRGSTDEAAPNTDEAAANDGPWTPEERAQLATAVRKAMRGGGGTAPADTPMWDTVARALGTGRTPAQCCAQYMRGKGRAPEEDRSSTKSSRGAQDSTDAGRAATPVLRARPGTLKGKQQMRAILDHEDAGHADDFFTSTPMRHHRSSVRLAGNANTKKVPAIVRPAPPSRSAEEPPGGTPHDTPGTRDTSGSFDTPGLLRKHLRRTDVDAYVGRTLHAKRKGTAVSRAHQPKKKTNSSHARDAAGELRKALGNTPAHTDTGDDDEEEDYYFSD